MFVSPEEQGLYSHANEAVISFPGALGRTLPNLDDADQSAIEDAAWKGWFFDEDQHVDGVRRLRLGCSEQSRNRMEKPCPEEESWTDRTAFLVRRT